LSRFADIITLKIKLLYRKIRNGLFINGNTVSAIPMASVITVPRIRFYTDSCWRRSRDPWTAISNRSGTGSTAILERIPTVHKGICSIILFARIAACIGLRNLFTFFTICSELCCHMLCPCSVISHLSYYLPFLFIESYWNTNCSSLFLLLNQNSYHLL
jgi:hypothetical protein